MLKSTLEGLLQTSTKTMEELMLREMSPFTMNESLFQTIQKKRYETLKRKVIKAMACSSNNDNNEHITDVTATAIESIFTTYETEPMHDYIVQEMEITLDAMGKVVSQRVIDEVPMLIRNMCDSILPAFQTAANPTDTQLEDLFAESSTLAKRRQAAQHEYDVMAKAMKGIDELRSKRF